MRRVATIALVHETLSEGLGETVDFDDVVGRTLSLAVELAVPSASVKIRREGRFGELRAENATPLALVLTELVTNAVTHAGGAIRIVVEHGDHTLRLAVHDDTHGVPALRDAASAEGGFGLRIVDRVSASWGWEQTASGKVVWSALDCCVDNVN
jgi:two-component sensor histidine kinase